LKDDDRISSPAGVEEGPVFPVIVQFTLSATAIVIAGIFLSKAADSIAESTRLGRLLVGSVLLAGATSLPELFVDISAIQKGMPDLAVGDLMGSSLANLLILAIADLFHRKKNSMFSREGAIHALSGAMSINLAALAGGAIFIGDRLSAFDVGPIGIGPLAMAGTYLLGLRLVYFDQRIRSGEVEKKRFFAKQNRALAKELSIFLAGALVILVSAPFLAEAAGKIANLLGVGETFIGSTLVALSTSLPEAVSTLAAVRMGAIDLAIGNIYGSNAFNMVLLVPLDLFHEGSLLASVSRAHLLTCLAVILATSVAVMGQLYQVESRKRFIEPDAFAIIGIVVGALFLLFHSAPG